MGTAVRLGRSLFGLGALSMGVLSVAFASPVLGLEPLPDWLPARSLWMYAVAILLVVSGACVLSDRLRPRRAAMTLSVLLSLWFLLLQVPALVTHVHNGNRWTTAFECLALCSAAWVMVYVLSDGAQQPSPQSGRLARMAESGRYGFGISLPVFGALHFVYWQYVASVIPGWIPGSPVFWTYFTGVAHVAAGVAILSGVQARLAATMLGIMFGSWVFIVHLPRVIATPRVQSEWTSLVIAVALCGGAWLLSGYLAEGSNARVRDYRRHVQQQGVSA